MQAYSASLTGVQLGGRGETSPALFENQKKCLIFKTKALVMSIFELNFPFKTYF